ncbi:MAG TPA: AAA family ATPase [Acidimicrobiales bacterium]
MPQLVGREDQQAAIDRLLAAAREGRSGALVLRGDAGIGKSALLDHAVRSAGGMRVLRGVGIESEAELAFGALHLLLHPFLDRLDRLPGPQAAALRTAFGLAEGSAPSRFLVGAGTLGLLAELGTEAPLLVVIDDAQWLDRSSSDALLFAARRLQADPVAILFAARHGAVPFAAPGVASIEVPGLPPEAAADLLDGQAPGLAAPLRARVLAEAGGNPLALIELGTSYRAAQDAGTVDLAEQVAPLQVTWRVQEAFRAQIAGLPEATRLALEVAAADSAARFDVILRAMAAVGVSADDLAPAERARLVTVSASGLAFRHPLIRAAAYQQAPHHRRVAIHRAFADAEPDRDRRAWHLAAATTAPDEAVAAELARTAERAEARGGAMAVSAAYDRSARLSTDPDLKAVRLVRAAHAAYAAGHPDRAERLATEAQSLTATAGCGPTPCSSGPRSATSGCRRRPTPPWRWRPPTWRPTTTRRAPRASSSSRRARRRTPATWACCGRASSAWPASACPTATATAAATAAAATATAVRPWPARRSSPGPTCWRGGRSGRSSRSGGCSWRHGSARSTTSPGSSPGSAGSSSATTRPPSPPPPPWPTRPGPSASSRGSRTPWRSWPSHTCSGATSRPPRPASARRSRWPRSWG